MTVLCYIGGLIDSCVEQLKQVHSQLHLESVRLGKTFYRKKVRRDWMEISSLTVVLCFSIGQNIHIMNTFMDKYYEKWLTVYEK